MRMADDSQAGDAEYQSRYRYQIPSNVVVNSPEANYKFSQSGVFPKNIHVNPLCSRNLLINKEKFVTANYESSNLGKKLVKKSENKIYYNPKFLQCQVTKYPGESGKMENIHINPTYLHSSSSIKQPSVIHVNRNFLVDTNTNIRLAKSVPDPTKHLVLQNSLYQNAHGTKLPPGENIPSIAPNKTGPSKYKYINRTVVENKNPGQLQGVKLKTKYSIRKTTPLNKAEYNSIYTRKIEKKVSSEFKRINARKIIRRSILKAKIEKSKKQAGKPQLRRSLVTRYKVIRTNRTSKKDISLASNSTSSGEFSRVSTTKLIRKSVLQQHIENRRQVRTNVPKMSILDLTWLNTSLKNKSASNHSFWKHKAKEPAGKIGSKHAKQNQLRNRRIIHNLTKLLRKNNQHCAFFNRFGRCKGKDKGTCTKIHDPKYVAICRRLLQGECSNKDCLLSHDVRPEKMPTCLHYLAGLCKREDCPFLHIKVNEKAPVCTYFLQGFCADVYKCTKRHEYICPIFAEMGSCPKGKSCVYPHKSRTIKSKLLETDQKPLILKRKKAKALVRRESEAGNEQTPVSSDVGKSEEKSQSETNRDSEPKPFTRYFSMPFAFDPSCDNEKDSSSDDDDGDSDSDNSVESSDIKLEVDL
ncbi:zinc finger CCCH domain-containing protein 3 [Cimex lectularius]|uniref:C3H1-type domain-containing protein n=1 Tax=Cimex lectularius TaxID=79782 RepID=A0A8I6S9N3_CIMLE|nr:zinc finger CCCH domain-containing protein 3 [Cimex lectularius]